MTYTATAAWLRERAWFGFVVGGVAWVVWLGSLAVGGWYKDAEGTLVGSDHVAFYMAGRCVRDDRQADVEAEGDEQVRVSEPPGGTERLEVRGEGEGQQQGGEHHPGRGQEMCLAAVALLGAGEPRHPDDVQPDHAGQVNGQFGGDRPGRG